MSELKKKIPSATRKRFPIYLRVLLQFQQRGVNRVMSYQIGRMCDVEANTVRRDLMYLKHEGKPAYGYYVDSLINAFNDAGINCSSLIKDKTRKTITKTRISGSCSHSITQQIVRIDRQTNAPLSAETELKLIAEAEKLIPEHDAVILSDYHIGTLTDKVVRSIVDIAHKYNKKVIVDAQKDLSRYKGITSMTPNLPDTQKHAGFYLKNKEDFLKAGNLLLEKTGCEAVLITCGADGMVVIEKNNHYTHIPVFNKAEVFDVTGAGDTVTAVYTLALAVGAEPVYAAIIGNIAAGIVIKQYGCATTTIDEIINSIPNKIEIEE